MTTTHRINSDLDSAAQSIANHLASCASIANGITQRVLSLSDDDLVAWLNEKGDPTPMFTDHGELGDALNAAAVIAQRRLAEWGLTKAIPTVDVRPVPDKLAEQYRAIQPTAQGWLVAQLERPPAPAPEPEPQPE